MDAAISVPAAEEASELSKISVIIKEECNSTVTTNIESEQILSNDIQVDTDIAIEDSSNDESEEISNNNTNHEPSSISEKVSNDIDSCTCTEHIEDKIFVDFREESQADADNVVNDLNIQNEQQLKSCGEVGSSTHCSTEQTEDNILVDNGDVSQNGVGIHVANNSDIQNDKQSKSCEELGSTTHCSSECTNKMELLTSNTENISEFGCISDLKTPCSTDTPVGEISSQTCNCNSPEDSDKKKPPASPQSEVKVHFASPLTVLHEYVELSECATQSTVDLMDYENSEEHNGVLAKSDEVQLDSKPTGDLSQNKHDFTEDTELSIDNINTVSDMSLFLSNCNSDREKQTQGHENICITSKLASKEENVFNTSLEGNLEKENGVIREFDFLLNESEVICTKIGLSDSVSVCDIGVESDKVIDNEVRDILNELVDKCCQVSLDTEICLHNDLSIEEESSKNVPDNGERKFLSSQVNVSKTQEYGAGDDLTNDSSEISDEKHRDLSCCEGNHKKELMDDFNTAFCSIDHLIQEPEIALCADSAFKDSQISVVTNSCHSSLEEEGEIQCNRRIDGTITEVDGNLSLVKQNERNNSMHENSCDKITGFTCSCINIENCSHGFGSNIELAKNGGTFRVDEKSADEKLQEGTKCRYPETSEKSYSMVSELNSSEETCISSHGNKYNTKSQSTSVKTEQEVKEEISQSEEGEHVEIQSFNSTSLDLRPFSTSNHESIELGSKHLNGSLKRSIHMANSNLREEELNLADNETPVKCIKPDVLEQHQTLSANSKIVTKHTDMNNVQLLDSSKDSHENEQDELEERNCKTVISETSSTSIQNGLLQSNLTPETISTIIQLDNEETGDNYGFVSASEFHSSQLSDKSTGEATNNGNDLQFQDMLDTPVITEEDYQSPCKLQKYDIIDCHLSGEYSTRSMDQAVPGEENSTEIMDTDIRENDTFYGQNNMLKKVTLELSSAGEKNYNEESTLNVSIRHHSSETSEDDGMKNQCFKWKYTPSLDLESTVPFKEMVEDQSFTIPPLQTCHKPVRVGLSRKQKVRSLHPRCICQNKVHEDL